MNNPGQPSSAEADFMSVLSHQLNTPIGTIRWYAELLRMGKMTTPLDAGQDDMVKEILLGVTRMSDLLTDIHDSSRLEQGKFVDEQVPVSLANLVSTVKDQHQAEVTAKKLEFTVTANQGVPDITVRLSIITIIVQNLLSNAIKYTPESGAIKIEIRQVSDAETTEASAGGNVLLSVADNGYGIPKDQHDKVFSRFFRADNISNIGVEGTGLGLYIVATAVAKLGGKVWFESEKDHGTTVFVTLPIKTWP